jgi:hypothetical protein
MLYGVKDRRSHSSTRSLTSCAVVFILHILPRYMSSSHYSKRKWNMPAKLTLWSTSKWRASTLQNCLGPSAVSRNPKTPMFQRQSSLWNAGVFELPVSPREFFLEWSPWKPQNLNMSEYISQDVLQNNCASIITLFSAQSTETNMCWNM